MPQTVAFTVVYKFAAKRDIVTRDRFYFSYMVEISINNFAVGGEGTYALGVLQEHL